MTTTSEYYYTYSRPRHGIKAIADPKASSCACILPSLVQKMPTTPSPSSRKGIKTGNLNHLAASIRFSAKLKQNLPYTRHQLTLDVPSRTPFEFRIAIANPLILIPPMVHLAIYSPSQMLHEQENVSEGATHAFSTRASMFSHPYRN